MIPATMRRIAEGVVLCYCGLAAALAQDRKINASQPNAGDERFRVSTYLVTVDVVVTDKKGRPALDLKPEDFSIFEDDVAQALEFFQIEGKEHKLPSAPVVPLASKPDDADGTPPDPVTVKPERPNLIVLLLDYSTTSLANQKLVRDGTRKYISEFMDGKDLVAVFVFDSGLRALQAFTSDRQKLLGALAYSGSRGDAMQGEHQALTLGASQAVEKQKALTNQIGGLLGAAAAAGFSSSIASALAMAQAELDMARHTELQYYSLKSSLDDQLSRSILLAIQAIADGLAPFHGRKTLVLMSQGFAVPPNVRRILHSALTASIRSNTAIHAIDARGLVNDKPIFETTELESISALQRGTRTRVVNGESQFDRAALIGTDQEESLLRYLSHSTGGLYLRNNNDLARGLKQVDEDVHAQYLLAYTTKNKKMDGKFRSIRVEVRPKGLKVRARKGYYAIP